jgi:MFS family permease
VLRQGLARYRAALAVRHVRPVLAATFATGLGTGALALVLVLLVAGETGSFSRAGLVSGAYLLATAVFGPPRGRLVDRLGPSRVLVGLALVHGVGLLVLLGLVLADAGAGALVVPATLAGVAAPTVGPSLRLLWDDLLGADRDVGYAMQTILAEAFLLIGPLVAAALAGLADPRVALAAVAVANVGGSLSFAATGAARRWRPRADVRRTASGALGSSGIRTLTLVTLPLGAAVGVIEVGAPAFAGEHGDAALGGVALAALAGGSLVAGLVYGGRSWPGAAGTRYVAIVGLLAVSMVPLPLAGSVATFVALMGLAGIAWAPMTAAMFAVVDDVAGPGTVAESVGWTTAMYMGGMALGYSGGGALVDAVGASPALWACPALGGLALVLATVRARTLLAGSTRG